MSARRHRAPNLPRRAALMVALLLAPPLAAAAQTAPAAPASSAPADMGGMDMGAMPGMPMPAAPASRAAPASAAPARKKPRRQPPPPSKDMQHMHHGSMAMPVPANSGSPAAAAPVSGSMQDMDHASMPGMDRGTGKGPVGAGMVGMSMGPMQGGDAPANARSPDYSDGVGYGSMQGMDMADNAPLGRLLIDQLEAFHGRTGSGQRWDAEAWYGNDLDKLWLRSEGDRRRGTLEEGDVEALWNHTVAPYWSTQLGVRQDLGVGPGRSWAAFGVQGLAPYWFELEATGYVGPAGRTAARLRATYELLLTQQLILQPEAEINLYGRNDPQRRIGSGVSDVQFGLRLRYEIRRQFAPYIGVNWVRRVGTTAGYARQDHQPVFDPQLVAGLRLWF